MEEMFRFADELGPAKIVHLHDPGAGLKAIVVIDNVACGPAIGGVRMAPDVGVAECFRLARAMTLKNAAAGLPHGGAKSVLFGDPHMAEAEKERLVRAFAKAIQSLTDYIPGPDMGTNERCMAWVKDEIGRAVGLPPEIGGIPLDRIGATGLGVAVAAEIAAPDAGFALKGARVVVQGFGAVGQHAARFLAEKGAVLIAAADSVASVQEPDGIDLGLAIRLKNEGRSLADYPRGRKGSPEDVLGVPCEIWIPAARPDVLRADNVDRVQARLIVQGANVPASDEAEAILHARGIVSIPDFIANAGGVICAAVEYHGGAESMALATIREKIAHNTRAVLDAAKTTKTTPRAAANAFARARVLSAMALRRRY
jgi:glutamate dehydrogenase (NAD(P)+)